MNGAFEAFRICEVITLSCFWIIVVAILSHRNQLCSLAISIKISIALYPFQLGVQIAYLFGENLWKNNALFLTKVVLFASNHWIFAWHYLQAACLFRLTFGAPNSYSQVKRVKKREKILTVVNLVGHITVLIVFSILLKALIECGRECTDINTIQLVCFVISDCLLVLLAVISLLAMCFIHRSS